MPKTAAAAAGAGGGNASQPSPEVPEVDLSGAANEPSAYMSSTVADEPQVGTFEPEIAGDGPKIAVDPIMAEGGRVGGGTSFSEISELPPLKEAYVAPPPPPPFHPEQLTIPAPAVSRGARQANEKPKVQTREVAQKAIKEIKNVPPKLMLYALAGAGALILAIGIGVTIYIHSLNSDDDSGAGRTAAAAQTPAQPMASQAAPKSVPDPVPTDAQSVESPESDTSAAQPVVISKARGAKKKVAAPAPATILGQLAIDSTPQGAQVQLDGKTDPSWVTPLALTNLEPGAHSLTVSKAGYSTDTRTVGVSSGNRATTIIHLAQLMATLVAKSDPVGANIYVDGHAVGSKTPAQVSVDKGQHVVLIRMPGYLDETMNAQFVLGQTFNFSPTLRPLGNADSIKTVGKMSKLFGGKGGQAGQATISIRTQPKGAQVAINRHMLDKGTPANVMLDPGNYMIDITLTGYAPVHKVITVDKDGKVVVDEVLQPQ